MGVALCGRHIGQRDWWPPARLKAIVVDFRISVIQFCCMSTAIAISPRGTLTLPIDIRRKLGLDKKHSLVLAEERPDGIFLHPAITVPIRDIPAATIKKWVKEDEGAAASVKIVKR
jgi:bifunctional DNA-binding transcriptional regulator/antitoxin component of YhaV-PrlF toxin-antitoxin module